MTSQVSICNRALSFLGAAPILTLDDASKEARECKRHYDGARDAELYGHPWNFAIRRASIGALATAPDWGYTKEFQIPADCLRVLEVECSRAWKREGQTIRTDSDAPLNILYIARVENPAEFSAGFAELLALRLAVHLAEPVTQSNTKKEAAVAQYERYRVEARRLDGLEGTPDDLPDESWLAARA